MLNGGQRKSRVTKRYSGEELQKAIADAAAANRRQTDRRKRRAKGRTCITLSLDVMIVFKFMQIFEITCLEGMSGAIEELIKISVEENRKLEFLIGQRNSKQLQELNMTVERIKAEQQTRH